MKVYTGGGDRGRTSLFSGERIAKDDVRVEAYGDVDELNSLLGAIITAMPSDCHDRIRELHQIQGDLFRVGACLATSGEDPTFAATRDLPGEKALFLEQAIDRMDEDLPRLSQFILPGGHPAACWSHVARCVCRRAERHTVRTVRQSPPARGHVRRHVDVSEPPVRLPVRAGTLLQSGHPDARHPLGECMTSLDSHASGNHSQQPHHPPPVAHNGYVHAMLGASAGFPVFQAGQRIQLLAGGKHRDYSLIPGDRHDQLTLLIRSVDSGVVSTHLSRCPLGTALDFSGPHGHFIYRPSSRPAIFVATGTGIAPFAAMCRTGIKGFVLLHGVRNVGDLYYRDLMEPAAARYIPCLTGETPSLPSDAFPGRVTMYLRNQLPAGEYDFYLAGRREMIAEVIDIVDDRFPIFACLFRDILLRQALAGTLTKQPEPFKT